MGPKAAEGHDQGQGWADRPALEVVQNLQHFSLLALKIEGLATVLGVMEHHNALANPDLISRLHERVRIVEVHPVTRD